MQFFSFQTIPNNSKNLDSSYKIWDCLGRVKQYFNQVFQENSSYEKDKCWSYKMDLRIFGIV